MSPTCISFFFFTHTYGWFGAELFEAPERRGDSFFYLFPRLVQPHPSVEIHRFRGGTSGGTGGGGGNSGGGGRSSSGGGGGGRLTSGGNSGGRGGGGNGGGLLHYYHATRLQKQIMFNEAPF